MAYKATKDTYGFAYSRDAFGVATAIRVQVMAGEDFPTGVEPEPDDSAVEEYKPGPYAGPQYSDNYIERDKRLSQRGPEQEAKARERATARHDADAQKLGHGKAEK